MNTMVQTPATTERDVAATSEAETRLDAAERPQLPDATVRAERLLIQLQARKAMRMK